MKKTTLIIVSIVIIIFIGIFSLYYFWFTKTEKEIAARCQGFVPNWPSFVDCYGTVAINDGWDMDYLSIRDHIRDYTIARVYNREQYLYIDNKVFVINRQNIESSSSDEVKTIYNQKLFQDGKLTYTSYDRISDIPIYLIIDTLSGEVKAYKDLNSVAKTEIKYFSEIEDKN